MQVLRQDGRQIEARVVFACCPGKSLDVAVLQVDAPFSSSATLINYWSTTSGENGCHGDKVTVLGYPLHQPSVQHHTPLMTSGCVSKVHYWEDVPVMYQVGVTIAGCYHSNQFIRSQPFCVAGDSCRPPWVQWWDCGCHGYKSTHWYGNKCYNVSDVICCPCTI